MHGEEWGICVKAIRAAAKGAVVLSLIVIVIVYSTEAAEGVKDGIELCLDTVVPSLFPMLLLCMLAVELGYLSRASRWIAPVTMKVLGIPGYAASAVLMSMIGGYPAGAKMVTELYRRGEISLEESRIMALFCFCAGPGFTVGIAGGLTGSVGAGWILLAVQTIAVLLISCAVCRLERGRMRKTVPDAFYGNKPAGTAEAIVSAVSKTAAAMLQICLYVVVFSLAGTLLEVMGISAAAVSLFTAFGLKSGSAEAIVPVLLEVTGGCVSAVQSGLPMMAFAIGFGGLSVHMQVLAITSQLGIDKKRFMLLRLIQGMLCALMTAAAVELLPEKAVFAAANLQGKAELSGSPQGALMLLVMCAVCVLCLPENGMRISGAHSK